MKPLVLLDVDGVVNAWPDRGSEEHSYVLNGFRVLIADETLVALRHVFRGAHEVVWLTAWREEANLWVLPVLRHHGVTEAEELGVITDNRRFDEAGFTTGWKLPAARDHEKVTKAVTERRPVIWIEDFGWSLDYGHGPRFTDVVAAGITGIDTAREGKLLLRHIEEMDV